MVENGESNNKGQDNNTDYWGLMGLIKDAPPYSTEYKKLENAFNRAHETRRFEIELYWKRANYFWLLQAAVFTAFGLSLSAENIDPNLKLLLPIVFTCLGFLCAYAGYLSAQASKFWQGNWEKHIDMLEEYFEGNLYKVVLISEGGVRHSLSRLNSSLIGCFSWFWFIIYIFLYSDLIFKKGFKWEYEFSCPWSESFSPTATLGIFSIVFVVITFSILRSQWSDFKLEDNKLQKICICQRYNKIKVVLLPTFRPIWEKNGWVKRKMEEKNK